MSPERRVDFMVAGAQRSGTSAIAQYLREHPHVYVPLKKELHFFDRDQNFAVEPVDYAPYHALFAPTPAQRLIGEATPDYLYWPAAPERMARYNPALKTIFVLRNPVTRAFSHWNMARHMRRESLSFLEAIAAEAERSRTLAPELAKRHAYLGRGLYAQQLERFWRHFPREQTIVFKSEELLESVANVLFRIAAFLGIEPFPPVIPRIAHAYGYDHTMTDEERRQLVRRLEPEIRALERLLGWDCSAWLA
ncbi:MAG: sulfotransferase domain-containing protein [Acidobacteriota bacterium]